MTMREMASDFDRLVKAARGLLDVEHILTQHVARINGARRPPTGDDFNEVVDKIERTVKAALKQIGVERR
jgi:hypothetical protein